MNAEQLSWPELTTSLLSGSDLTTTQARWAMSQVMNGDAAPIALAGFLVALRAKGETVTEIRALADVMLEHAVRIDVPGVTLDIVGTGGDRAGTVNVSTMAALVAAGAGVTIVKHGNRAASSKSGSADVLEALGVNLEAAPERLAEVAGNAGITFCFAQRHHPSMRFAAEARTGLSLPTAFNALGPLTNPGQPAFAAVGVADERLAPILAGVFAERNKPAAVFRGTDGLDEITIAAESRLWWVADSAVTEHTIAPDDVGIDRAPLETLRGGDAAYNAQVARDVLSGQSGPIRDAVVLNAGMALAVVAGASNTDRAAIVQAWQIGVDQARQAIDSGKAREVLDTWVAATA